MTKTCSKCKETKPVAEYYKRSASKDGLMYQCKACKNKTNIKYQQEDAYKQYKAEYQKTNEYRKRQAEYARRPEVIARAKQWRQENKEIIAEKHKQYRQENKEIIAERNKKWVENNKEHVSQYGKRYKRTRRAVDPAFGIEHTLRNRMRAALNGRCKADTTKALLGCTYEEACAHIEAQFTEGMSWDKMGIHGIHIDHIRPCASFDLTDPEQQRECFHYTNLQPLWAEDNLRKSDRW